MRQDFRRVGERHQTSPANKQKRRGRLDELQDLLEQERTAAKHAKLDYEEKAQQLEEAERMQLEFNEQKEEQQQEHAKQLVQHAKLQEELQEQEKHSEFVTKELEQQKSSWQQRNEEQLQELRELQSKMNSLKDAEAGEGINDRKYMYIYISCIYYICMILYVHGKYTASFLTSHRSPGHGSRGVMHSGASVIWPKKSYPTDFVNASSFYKVSNYKLCWQKRGRSFERSHDINV